MNKTPTDIRLHSKSRLLEIVFEDETFMLPCEYLRVNSPSAEVKGHGPGQEVLQLNKEDVNIVAIEPVGHYAVRLIYSDSHNSGLYSWDYLYELGKNRLLQLGYKEIGMDHFALPQDSLYQAYQSQNLHRNFMGYTLCNTDLLIGLGTSAISDAQTAYAQNTKTVEGYQAGIDQNKMALFRGHFLSEADQITRDLILKLICTGAVAWRAELQKELLPSTYKKLKTMQEEGLVHVGHDNLQVTTLGQTFIRNICDPTLTGKCLASPFNIRNLLSK